VKRLAQGKYLAREGRKASEEADKAKISCALWVDQVYLDEVWGLLSTVDNPLAWRMEATSLVLLMWKIIQ